MVKAGYKKDKAFTTSRRNEEIKMHECDYCSNEIDFHEIVECIASAL